MFWLYFIGIFFCAILNPISSSFATALCGTLNFYQIQVREVFVPMGGPLYCDFVKLNAHYIGAYVFFGILALFPQIVFMNGLVKIFNKGISISLFTSYNSFCYSQLAFLPVLLILPWDFGWHPVMVGRNIDVNALVFHLALLCITSVTSFIMFFKRAKTVEDLGDTVFLKALAKTAAIFMMLFAMGSFMYFKTPEYAVDQIKESIAERDYSDFCKYVDVDSITQQIESAANVNDDAKVINEFTKNLIKYIKKSGIHEEWWVNGHFTSYLTLVKDTQIVKENDKVTLHFMIYTSDRKMRSYVVFNMKKVHGRYKVVQINNLNKILEQPFPEVKPYSNREI